MNWINAFIEGPCTVSVFNHLSSVTPLWSGVLGLLGTSPSFSDPSVGNILNVTVDGGGNVALNYISGSGSTTNGYFLQVTPNYNFPGGMQASTMTIVAGSAHPSVSTSNASVVLSALGGGWTPDPASPIDSSPVFIGVYQGGSF